MWGGWNGPGQSWAGTGYAHGPRFNQRNNMGNGYQWDASQGFDQNLAAAQKYAGQPNANFGGHFGRNPLTFGAGQDYRQGAFHDAMSAWLGLRPTDQTALGGWLAAMPNMRSFQRGGIGPDPRDLMNTTGPIAGAVQNYAPTTATTAPAPVNRDMSSILRNKYGDMNAGNRGGGQRQGGY